MTGSDNSDGNARPISVAELLAKNGTIGAPPVGGRRRRRRGKTDAVTVAELTGEIPVIRTEEPDPTPVTDPVAEQPDDADTDVVPSAEVATNEDEAVGSDAGEETAGESVGQDDSDLEVDEEAVDEDLEADGETAREEDAVDGETAGQDAEVDTETGTEMGSETGTVVEGVEQDTADDPVEHDTGAQAADQEDVEENAAQGGAFDQDTDEQGAAEGDALERDAAEGDTVEQDVVEEVAPKRRRFGFGRFSVKRSSAAKTAAVAQAAPVADAEHMSPDPPDDGAQTDELDAPVMVPALDIEELDVVAEPEATEEPEPELEATEEPEPEAGPDADVELPSYLRSTQGVLFGGQTIADDLARRGTPISEEVDLGEAGGENLDIDEDVLTAEPGRMSRFVHALWIVGQSIFAVLLGAGLFVAFDQLWRWNNIIALVLSVLVILGLVVGVRVVRKTEDIGSTLIAVVVGALVTLGPLALLQSG